MKKENMKNCTEISKEEVKMKIVPDLRFRNENKVRLRNMYGDIYIAYHRLLNSYHWIWEGKPLTSQHQCNMEDAKTQFKFMVAEHGDPEDLGLYYRMIRIEVEDRKIGKFYPVAGD